jgi:hypothetical protein
VCRQSPGNGAKLIALGAEHDDLAPVYLISIGVARRVPDRVKLCSGVSHGDLHDAVCRLDATADENQTLFVRLHKSE